MKEKKKKGKYWVKNPWLKGGYFYTKNLNPRDLKVGDCAIRAIMAFSNCTKRSSWYKVYNNLFTIAIANDSTTRNKDTIMELLNTVYETEVILDPYKDKEKEFDPELDKQISIKEFMKNNSKGYYFVIIYKDWETRHAICIKDKVIYDYNTNYTGEEKVVWAIKKIKKK